MLIPELSNSLDPRSAASPVSNDTLDRDDFLLLLVTQLSNQDPLNPMDGQQFAAQLAQFSSLEQLININDGMATNAQLNGLLAQSINSGVAAGLIGKEVEAVGDTFTFNGEESQTMHYELEHAAAAVSIDVFDEAGRKVRTIDAGPQGKGERSGAWDGKDEAGETVPAGKYTFKVNATDSTGASITATQLMRGTVDRVSFSQGGILLWIGDESIVMGNVRSVIG
ncbi:MAG: flagellar hook capping FlgD N-terminal domain-containing protein [Rhodothermales bacterium]|nr:flagellar hook capping FlgD N-terminal domain-containing protein [Rhodothermales bacterium]